jgi:hypothetical protein
MFIQLTISTFTINRSGISSVTPDVSYYAITTFISTICTQHLLSATPAGEFPAIVCLLCIDLTDDRFPSSVDSQQREGHHILAKHLYSNTR